MVKITSGEDAWRYFESTVSSSADGGAASSYYAAEGTPPGRWYGSGLTSLGLEEGRTVSASQLSNLFGKGAHPSTGEQLARNYVIPPTLEERVDAAINALNTDLSEADREAAINRIVVEQTARTPTSSVAGFEIVFNPPKSVSALWALADSGTKAQLQEAHEQAMQDTLAILETDALRTRTGTDGVAQAEVAGLVATGYDHWDTRDGDPQLHTHVLIANRVQGADGKWRTIDSRHALSPHIVTLSETYTAALMDTISVRLGLEWAEHESTKHVADYGRFIAESELTDSQQSRALFATQRGVAARNQKWEIAGVPPALLDAFSTRKKAITLAKDNLIQEYMDKHGKEPSRLTIWRMRSAATRSTRKAKHVHTLEELSANWNVRAAAIVGDPATFVESVTRIGRARLGTARVWSSRDDDLGGMASDEIANAALRALTDSRATWSRANALAEVQRILKPVTFRSIADRDQASKRILDLVIARAVPITPRNPLHAPREFQQSDGTSQFAPLSRELFTTADVLSAEDRLLEASAVVTPLAMSGELAHALLEHPTRDGKNLGDDQRAAVANIVTSGRAVDLLVGPAGAGKTTTLAKLRDLWETQYGDGSVVGLAPSAVAAQVLGDALDIDAENTAMWITRSKGTDSRFTMKAGQLIIVDEAGMSGTLALDELRRQAEVAGAKVLLVGDWAQLGAVDAGGAFALLTAERDGLPELVDVWRFKSGGNSWQADASALLRIGAAEALQAYENAGWIAAGDATDMMGDALSAWKEDTSSGLESLLIASNNDTVATLNAEAQQWLLEKGTLGRSRVMIANGAHAHVGDRIVTRSNDRSLRDSQNGWVRNGQEWVVERVRRDGSIVTTNTDGATLTLSPDYLRDNVQLAYASTAHRSQGRTVDTTHSIVDSTVSREVLYVAMTRGKSSNRIYVTANEQADQEHDQILTLGYMDVLEGVVRNSGVDASATTTIHAERERVTNYRQLAAEYDTLASSIAHERYGELLVQELPAKAVSALRDSDGYDALLALLRRADSHGLDLTQTLRGVVTARELATARDTAATVHYRLDRVLTKAIESAPANKSAGRLIAGLTPAIHSDNPDFALALQQREEAMKDRAEQVFTRAQSNGQPWAALLGSPGDGEEQRWREAAHTIAAYRDKWAVTDAEPLGRIDNLNHQRRSDYDRANQALRNGLIAAGLVIDDAAEAQTRYAALIREVLSPEHAERAISAPAFAVLADALARAETSGIGLRTLLPELLDSQMVDGSRDYSAFLHYRLGQHLAHVAESTHEAITAQPGSIAPLSTPVSMQSPPEAQRKR